MARAAGRAHTTYCTRILPLPRRLWLSPAPRRSRGWLYGANRIIDHDVTLFIYGVPARPVPSAPSVLARNEFGTTRSDAAVLPVQLQLAGCVLFSIANLAVARAYMDHRGRAREGTRVSGLYEAYVDTFPCFYAVPILVVRRRSKAPQRTLPL